MNLPLEGSIFASNVPLSGLAEFEPAMLVPLVAALDATDAIVALYDPDDMLVAWNAAFARCFLRGLRRTEVCFADIIRHGFHHGLGVKIDSGDVERFLAGVLTRRRSEPRRALQTDLVDGTWLWITETTLRNGWFLTVGTDITALKQHERTLTSARDSALREAQTDALTRLPNRRAVIDEFCRVATANQSQPVSIALVDLDHFKAINDRHGHDFGDEVLRDFGRVASGWLTPGMFARLGGEEFVWVVPELAADWTCAQLDALQAGLPAINVPGRRSLRYTFSAGVTEWVSGEDFSGVLRRADSALYAAKAAGRHRVVVERA